MTDTKHKQSAGSHCNSLRPKINHLLLLLAMLCASVSASAAYDFKVDGVYYKYLSKSTCAVSYNSKTGSYFGSVTIPEEVTLYGSTYKVTAVADSAFYYSYQMTDVSLPSTITTIGKSAFYFCDALTSISIPASVTSIGKNAFQNCNNLTRVDISDLSAWCGISFENNMANPLYYAKRLYNDGSEITELVIPDDIAEIGSYAFYNCTGITSAKISHSVSFIDEAVFYGCTGLTTVHIPGSVSSIGSEAFVKCSNLTKVDITDLLVWCGINFKNYNSNPLRNGATLSLNGEDVTDLLIPDDVPSISQYAFQGCRGLNSITIPSSVTSIGRGAFKYCSDCA